MPKPTLTPSNVSKFTADLYALSDSMVLLEADKVAADFSTWLNSIFDLTPEQFAYVSGYPIEVNRYYGFLFAATFMARGPIIFGVSPDNPAPRRFKETRANMFGTINYNDDTKELTGNMDVTIEFALL